VTTDARDQKRLVVFDRRRLHALPRAALMAAEHRHTLEVVSAVLPFRVNNYVIEQLIDWSRVPADPIFQLVFPQREMLEPADFARVASLLRAGASDAELGGAAREIQRRLNPHPAGQLELNVPYRGGTPLRGLQHKYRETVLFFPSQGQTCHAYCNYCFRWPQFVGVDDMRFASSESGGLVAYLRAHPEVTSVLFTGGDPLVMRTNLLRRYVEPLLEAGLEHLTSIRFGTKALAYWPQRFVTDRDADDLLRLFEQVVDSGKSLALMAHYSHPRELSTDVSQTALRRVLHTGAVVRCQAPIVRHVNDDADVWADLWRTEVRLGAVPYYMFVARDTGARRYFELPLVRAYEVYRDALARVSGLARTVRGPSMSATPGKVVVDGTAEIGGQRVFVLRFLQARDPQWVGRPFFAERDDAAVWFDQLTPAFGAPQFFFAEELGEIKRRRGPHPPSQSSSSNEAGAHRAGGTQASDLVAPNRL
jgi:L-lysine 2,3-aminomutase